MLYKSIEEWRGIIFYAFSFYLCCFLSKIVCKFKANFVRKRCQARLLNRETSIDSIITTSTGQSIVKSNNKATSINLFSNDYDPH